MVVVVMRTLSLCFKQCLLSLIPSRTASPEEGKVSPTSSYLFTGIFFLNSDFRAQLLAAKQVTGVTQQTQHSLPLKEKIKAELTRF